MLFAIYILLDIPLHVQEEAVLHADFTKLLDMDNLGYTAFIIRQWVISK